MGEVYELFSGLGQSPSYPLHLHFFFFFLILFSFYSTLGSKLEGGD
jgi:hypothetical protein